MDGGVRKLNQASLTAISYATVSGGGERFLMFCSEAVIA